MCALCMLKVNGIVGGYSFVRSVVGSYMWNKEWVGKKIKLFTIFSDLIVIFD